MSCIEQLRMASKLMKTVRSRGHTKVGGRVRWSSERFTDEMSSERKLTIGRVRTQFQFPPRVLAVSNRHGRTTLAGELTARDHQPDYRRISDQSVTITRPNSTTWPKTANKFTSGLTVTITCNANVYWFDAKLNVTTSQRTEVRRTSKFKPVSKVLFIF